MKLPEKESKKKVKATLKHPSLKRRISEKANVRTKNSFSQMKNSTKLLGKDEYSTIEHLKQMVGKFCRERGWDEPHNPKDLAVGVVTEASELLELFRFCSEKESYKMIQDATLREKMGEELADTLCFLLRFAELYQFDVTSCLEDKLTKTAVKYPKPTT